MRKFVAMEVLDKITMGSTTVAIGHHEGKHEMDENHLYDDERALIKELSPRKRSEWIASRDLLYQIAGLPDRVRCLYDDFGKPYLEGSQQHISVSHSELWCAAMISDVLCGVDIQVYSDTVRRIAHRFLTAEDLSKAEKEGDSIAYLHLLWGAKECMYKAYGKKKLGFREHIFITSLQKEKGEGFGEIIYEGIHLTYDIYFRLLPEVAWVFCVERSTSPVDTD